MSVFGKNVVNVPASSDADAALGFININVMPEGSDTPKQVGFIKLSAKDPAHKLLFQLLEGGEIDESELDQIFTFTYRKNEKKAVTGFARKTA